MNSLWDNAKKITPLHVRAVYIHLKIKIQLDNSDTTSTLCVPITLPKSMSVSQKATLFFILDIRTYSDVDNDLLE